jgi:hypothetical protein
VRTAFVSGIDGVRGLASRRHGPESRLARTWPIRTMAIATLVMLLAYLALYYV